MSRLTRTSFAALAALVFISFPSFAQTDAQKSFDSLKALAGAWEGTITVQPVQPEMQGKHVQVLLRVTSLGHALLHDVKVEGRQDNPITMLYLDGDQLMLTHYCDAGNRPRMIAKSSPDGKTLEFTLLDVAGSTEYGHMHHAVFTLIDADHHTEDWTFKLGDNSVEAHLDLHRAK